MRVLLFGFCALFMPMVSLEAQDASELAKRLDRKPEVIRRIDAVQYFAQDGRSVNFGMDGLRWTGPGDCDSQTEAMSAIFELQGKGVKLRRAYILEAPDGIHVKNSDCVIEDLVFPDVCEDAITADHADRLVIRNCVFRGARDKVIQINHGREVLVENCYFEDSAKPIRIKPGVTVTVRNCVAKNVECLVLADGEGAEAVLVNNRVSDAKRFVGAKDGAVIRIGDNRLSGIRSGNEIRNGGRVVPLSEAVQSRKE